MKRRGFLAGLFGLGTAGATGLVHGLARDMDQQRLTEHERRMLAQVNRRMEGVLADHIAATRPHHSPLAGDHQHALIRQWHQDVLRAPAYPDE